MSQTIINGDSAEVLKQFESNTIDAVITDPPYGIEFLGKEWDQDTGAIDIWRECLRVLKPGGFLLAFSAARTYHHLATNIESVGFEIRDQIMWIYASGFPKAQDIGKAIQRRQGVEKTELYKHNHPRVGGDGDGDAWQQNNVRGATIPTSPEAQQWAGWKTALKPAHEPIVMARKPMKGSTIDNVLEHGVGALNIDASRIATDELKPGTMGKAPPNLNAIGTPSTIETSDEPWIPNEQGRYPSNVLGDIADYQKYFYCPKVSRAERHRGFEQDQIPDPLENYSQGTVKNHPLWDPSIGTNIQRLKHKILEHEKTLGQQHPVQGAVGNNHPTVKPVALMRYLVKLVTPQGSHIIDPFSGSGSTGMACRELGRTFTGIDLDRNYCEIARRRIAATREDLSETLFE